MQLKGPEDIFPSLANDPHEITSPESTAYNCVAWALGDADRWWSPEPDYFWPVGAPREMTIEAFLETCCELGFEACDDGRPEEGFEKIALYGDPNSGEWKHVARQLEDGRWTSKLGSLVDIVHELAGVVGAMYGQVVQFMKRRRVSQQ